MGKIFIFILMAASITSAAPGDLDTTFGVNGRSETSVNGIGEIPARMAVQADGKIVIAGNSFNGSSLLIAVARYRDNGSLDTAFGTGGVVRFGFGDIIAAATDIAIQSDGKIVIAGLASAGFGADINFAVARLDQNGALDPSFDGDGRLTTSFDGNLLEAAFGIAIHTDGRIVVAGSRQNSLTGESWFAIARYNTNGSLDASFDSDGRLFLKAGTANEVVNLAQDVAIQPDGRIIIAGEIGDKNNSDFALVRLNTDGSLDPSFDGDGKVRTSVSAGDDSAYAVEIIQGKIIAAGFADTDPSGAGNYDFAIVRYRADGALDTTFAATGKTTVSFGPAFDTEQAYDIVPGPGGTFYICGQSGISGDPVSISAFAMARLKANGDLDTSFGALGKVTTAFSGPESIAYGGVLTGGKLILGGFTGDTDEDTQEARLALAKYEGAGVIDPYETPFDYDGDGKADISVFRPSVGDWYLQNTSEGYRGVHFGASEDMPAPADFDGDGRTDIAVFRPSTGDWYRLNSSDGSYVGIHFGNPEDKPAVGDFDGDGKADISVYRPSVGDWYRLNSSNGEFTGLHFGAAGDKPVVGDFDGDGKADISVYRPAVGDWYRLNSSDGQFTGLHFGVPEDNPVPADYDGDGKTDIAVYRPSVGDWYWLNSGSGNSFSGIHWGAGQDKPAPADLDGDGKADIAVFRPSDGNWYILGSAAGYTAVHFGVSEDLPTPASFIY